MMLKPSIDKLLERVDSKYSLVVLGAKRAHELRDGEPGVVRFKSLKPNQEALEEIEAGMVVVHPDNDAKYASIAERDELLRLYRKVSEARVRHQIEIEQDLEDAKAASSAEKKRKRQAENEAEAAEQVEDTQDVSLDALDDLEVE